MLQEIQLWQNDSIYICSGYWMRFAIPLWLAHAAHRKLMMCRGFLPMKAWTYKQTSCLWDSSLPSKTSSGDVGGKCVICETDARLCCWNMGLLQNPMFQGTSSFNDKPSPHHLHKLWLATVSFLAFLEMSEPQIHLYWLANKLLVFFCISWMIRTHVGPFSPPMFTPAH